MIYRKITVPTGWKRVLPALWLGLLLPLLANAQDQPASLGTTAAPLLFPLDTFRQTVVAEIDLAAGTDSPVTDTVAFAGRLKQISMAREGVSTWDSTAYFVDDPLTLERGDIIISYRLPPTREQEFYEVRVSFSLNGAPLQPDLRYLRGAVGSGIEVAAGEEIKEIAWTNLLEQYINLNGELRMELTVVLHGMIPGCLEVDCTAGMPAFNRKPFLWAGIAGAALIGVGQIFDSRADDKYEDYATFKPLDNPETDPEDLYQDANGDHHTYLALTYAGISVLAVDAAWYLIKELSHQRKVRRYRECCRDNALTIRPVVDLPQGDGLAQMGLKIRLNF